MPKLTTAGRLAAKRKEYAEKYNLDDLRTGNDKANLELLLNYEVTIENLTEELHLAQDENDTSKIAMIVKTIDSILESKLKIEKSLGIDRIARKKESNTDSPADYISKLKQMSVDFLEKRLKKAYCPDCNILVMRFDPLTEHTKFDIKAQCSQCKKSIRVHREEKEIMFDIPVKDREWRKRYPIEIINSKTDTNDQVDSEEDEMIIGGN